MFNLNASLKILLEPFNPTEDEISGFASHIKFNGYTDSHYKIKKVLIPALKEQQYLRVFKKIEGIRSQFKDFTGRIPLIFDDMYLVRVDDYPHWSCNIEQFTKFLDIMVQNDITFLLGVTPMLSYERHSISNDRFRTLTENEVNLLKKYKNVEIALHGLTHQTIRKKPYSEFVGLSETQTKEKIIEGIKILSSFGLYPLSFIAPFDTFDKTNFQVLLPYFQIICGGYPTASTFGFWITPCVFNETIYVASYKPFSGRIKNILNAVLKKENYSTVIGITLHWAAEVEDKFANLKKLAELLKGKTLSWQKFYQKAKHNNT